MNGRDLLCAVAGADEAYVLESERFEEIAAGISAERQRRRRRAAAAGLAAAVCAAAFAALRQTPEPAKTPAPPETSDRQTTGTGAPSDRETASSAPQAEPPATTARTDETDAPTETKPPVTERTTRAPAAPETAAPPETTASAEEPMTPPETAQPTDNPTEPHNSTVPTDSPTEPLDPTVPTDKPTESAAVYSEIAADYATAREAFGRPLAACGRSGFNGYRLGIVSRHGDINEAGAYCLSVTYVFTDGWVKIMDQDRLGGSGPGWTEPRPYAYRGRTFYIGTDDRVRVWYAPTGESGLVYAGEFDEGAELGEILDLVLSLEI